MGLTPLTAVITAALIGGAPTRPVLFDEVYTPASYDSNDNVEIMVETTFSDTCWQVADTPVSIDAESKTIHINALAVQTGEFCQPMLRPVQKLIRLGKLPPGTYAIVQGEDQEVIGGIRITRATSETVDDQPYAPVSEVRFQSALMGSGILVTGHFPESCLELEEVPISIEERAIVIRPIVTRRLGVTCEPGSFPFRALTYLDYVKEGRYLLQVRSMNGEAVNRIVEIH